MFSVPEFSTRYHKIGPDIGTYPALLGPEFPSALQAESDASSAWWTEKTGHCRVHALHDPRRWTQGKVLSENFMLSNIMHRGGPFTVSFSVKTSGFGASNVSRLGLYLLFMRILIGHKYCFGCLLHL